MGCMLAGLDWTGRDRQVQVLSLAWQGGKGVDRTDAWREDTHGSCNSTRHSANNTSRTGRGSCSSADVHLTRMTGNAWKQ